MRSPCERFVFSGVSLLAAFGAAAQPCIPAWDVSVGAPGVTSDGYIGPMAVWNDGSGTSLFVGGSFSSVGGFVTRGLARLNLAAGSWSEVGGGCYSTFTNYFVAAMTVHHFDQVGERLVVGGSFATAGNVPGTTNLAAWNGSGWSALGAPNGAIWAAASFQGELYVGGGFTMMGSVPANGIAKFNGEEWTAVGSGYSGGFAPNVFAMKVFNDGSGDKLYVGGRFGSIGGVNGLIARWTGTAWQPVGGGIVGTTFSDIEAMEIFDEDGAGPMPSALYVGGYTFRPVLDGQPLCSVAKWDGVSWRSIGADLGGRTTSLVVFNDGAAGPRLYAGGTAQPGINYLARLEGTAWVTAHGGIGAPGGPPFPSVFGLHAHGGKLYVGGDFDYVGQSQVACSGFAAYVGCAAPGCVADVAGGLNCPGGGACPDGGVTIDDMLAYLEWYSTGVLLADIDDGSFTNRPDGGVTIEDMLFFLSRFEAGC